MDPSTLFPQSSFNISDDTYNKLSSITDNLTTEASRALDYESSRLKEGLIIAIILTAFLGKWTSHLGAQCETDEDVLHRTLHGPRRRGNVHPNVSVSSARASVSLSLIRRL